MGGVTNDLEPKLIHLPYLEKTNPTLSYISKRLLQKMHAYNPYSNIIDYELAKIELFTMWQTYIKAF